MRALNERRGKKLLKEYGTEAFSDRPGTVIFLLPAGIVKDGKGGFESVGFELERHETGVFNESAELEYDAVTATKRTGAYYRMEAAAIFASAFAQAGNPVKVMVAGTGYDVHPGYGKTVEKIDPSLPTMTEVAVNELRQRLPAEMVGATTGMAFNTLTQYIEILGYAAYNPEVTRILVPLNGYFVQRASALMEHFCEVLPNPEHEWARRLWHLVKERGINITIFDLDLSLTAISEETSGVMPYGYDLMLKREPYYLQMVAAEEQGYQDILSGKYRGRIEAP